MFCPFCGLDPYEYIHNGIGMEAVAVNCCEWGWYYFDGGDEWNHLGMPLESVVVIKAIAETTQVIQNDLHEDDEFLPIPF